MRKRLNFFLVSFCLIQFTTFGQLTVDGLNYRTKIFNSSNYFKDTVTNHSGILPQIRQQPFSESAGPFINITTNQLKTIADLYPIAGLSIGGEYSSNGTSNLLYTAGIGAGLDLRFKKFMFTGKILPYSTQSDYLRDSIQKNFDYDPGASRSIFKNGFLQYEWLFVYQPNRIFTFLGGNGRNQFGEGYRSLILSDNAGSTPFFKIETNLKSIKYVNLFQAWKDNTVDPANRSLDRRKFAAMHYISWNITREFNLSIFESVVWQLNDTLINRGFDPNYLNPIVFYRPVEYNNGSSDNVLLGANMSFKFDKYQSIYTQLMLDDFLLSEIKARSRWWANKYAFQLGYKSRKFLGVENLYFQSEFNVVRPFTYSHKESIQSYGHLNSSVTHPIGANFFEVLGIVAYKSAKNQFTAKVTYSSFGVDSSDVSYGQNIFAPYGNRPGNYDQLIMQGFKKNVLNSCLIIERPLFESIQLYANITYNWRMELTRLGVQNQHYLTVGITSRLWNRFTDY